MDQTDRFECISKRTEPEPRIELKALATGEVLRFDAASLAAQYAISERETLLVLDENCPFEEQLHLILMFGSKVRDYIKIGWIYMPGIFKPIKAEGRELHFTFESDAIWTLSVRSRGRRVMGGLPTAARRGQGFFKKRFMFLQHGENS